MTKKDFELIASVIDDFHTWANPGMRLALAMAFAHRLAQEHPRFDRATFMRACGVTERA